MWLIWASMIENLSSRFRINRDSNQYTETCYKIELLVASLDLHLCCSQTSEDRFSLVKAHTIAMLAYSKFQDSS